MKIPKHVLHNEFDWQRIYSLWYKVADELSLETGIFIRVRAEYENKGSDNWEKVSRIFFVIMDHQFDSLHDLKKAIANKAFL